MGGEVEGHKLGLANDLQKGVGAMQGRQTVRAGPENRQGKAARQVHAPLLRPSALLLLGAWGPVALRSRTF